MAESGEPVPDPPEGDGNFLAPDQGTEPGREIPPLPPRERLPDWPSRIAVAVCVCAALAVSIFAGIRLSAPLPAIVPSASIAPLGIQGPAPAISLPRTGSFDLAFSDGEQVASFDPSTELPTGSVAKVMTAYLVLLRHPLGSGGGPTLTMTARDVSFLSSTIAEGGSYMPVTLGERLDERQLLLGLMLPSANNLAETLGVWVSGSDDSFVALMNREAASLGMMHTHFADTNGFSALTTSSSADLVKLGIRAMEIPAFRQIVGTKTAEITPTLTLTNLDEGLFGVTGWTGIKTGWTESAGGCLLFSATISVNGAPVSAVGAVLGQPADPAAYPAQPELGGAFAVAESAVTTAFADATTVPTAGIPIRAQPISTGWQPGVALRAQWAEPEIPVEPGSRIQFSLRCSRLSLPSPRGSTACGLSASIGGEEVATGKLVTEKAVNKPVWWKKLFLRG